MGRGGGAKAAAIEITSPSQSQRCVFWEVLQPHTLTLASTEHQVPLTCVQFSNSFAFCL